MHIVLTFLHNLGTGSSLPKTTLRAKINGEHVKIWDHLFISATIEARNFEFGIQLGLGEYATIKTLVRNVLGARWATGAPQKLSGPRTPYHVPSCTPQQLQKCNKTANINVKKTAV